MPNNQITFGINFTSDTTELKNIQQNLLAIKNISAETGQKLISSGQFKGTAEELERIKKEAGQVSEAFEKVFNSALGTANPQKMNRTLNEMGLNMNQITQDFSKLGQFGQLTLTQMQGGMAGVNFELKKAHPLISKIAEGFSKTFTWGVYSRAMNALMGSIQNAYSYAQKLDKSLNNIRIVTGKSSEEMAKFAIQANKAAKSLGASTTDYTNASLIYYQQGLSDAEVRARTEVTVKVANITKQSADEVSEQLTAVWNGYRVSAEEAELYIDKLSAVAASTASDLEELSTAMSKVASAAAAMGVDIDQLTAQISTIVSVTRQDAANVGTALKTIYARMGDLAVATDATDEFGVSLGDVSSKLAVMGVNVLDQQGNLRDMGNVIEEVAKKWGTWTEAQQQAAAVALAGKRQYNNLIALFNNWDMYQSALETSQTSEGTLQEQQDIYMESLEAHLAKLRTSAEKLYDVLFENKGFNSLLDTLSIIIDKIGTLIESFGGGASVISMLGTILLSVFGDKLASSLTNTIDNFKIARSNTQQYNEEIKQLKRDTEAVAEAQNEYNKAIQEGRDASEQKKSLIEAQSRQETQAQRVNIFRAARAGRIDSEKAAELANQANALGQQKLAYTEAKYNAPNILADIQKRYSNSGAIGESSNLSLSNLQKLLASGDSLDNFKNKWADIDKITKGIEKNIDVVGDKIKLLTKNDFNIPVFNQDIFKQVSSVSQEDANRIIELNQQMVSLGNQMRGLSKDSEEFQTKFKEVSEASREYKLILDKYPELYQKILAAGKDYRKQLRQKNINIEDIQKEKNAILQLAGASDEVKIKVDDLFNKFKEVPTPQNFQNLIKALEQLAQSADVDKDKIIKLIDALKQGPPTTEAFNNSINKLNPSMLAEKMTSIVTAISSIISAFQTLKGLTEIWEDENKATSEKVFQTFQALIGIIIPLTFAAKSLNKAFAGTGAAGVVAATGTTAAGAGAVVGSKGFAALAAAVWAAVWPLLLIVAILALAAGVIYGICAAIDAYKAAQVKAQTAEKEAIKNLEKQQEALENVKQAYDELKQSIEDYHDAQKAIDDLTVGTQEWRDAIIEANSQILELMNKYPELAKYITTGEGGRLSINESGLDYIREQQQDEIAQQQTNVSLAQLQKNRATEAANYERMRNQIGIDREAEWGRASESIAGGLATGATAGMVAGTFVPGAGTAIGGVVGASFGLVAGSVAAVTRSLVDPIYKLTEEEYEHIIKQIKEDSTFSNTDIKNALRDAGINENLDELAGQLRKNAAAINANTEAAKILGYQIAKNAFENTINPDIKKTYETSEFKEAMEAEASNLVTDETIASGAAGIKKESRDDIASRYSDYLNAIDTEGHIYTASGKRVFNEKGDEIANFANRNSSENSALIEQLAEWEQRTSEENLQQAQTNINNAVKNLEKYNLSTPTIRYLLNTAADRDINVGEISSSQLSELEKVSKDNNSNYQGAAREVIDQYNKEVQSIIANTNPLINDLLFGDKNKFNSDVTLEAKKKIAELINKIYTFSGESSATQLSDFLSQYSGEELDKVTALVNNIDWTKRDAFSQFRAAMNDANIEIKNSNGVYSNFINSIRESRSVINEITKDFQSYKNELIEINNIINKTKPGSIISDEDYQRLIEWNSELEDSFVFTKEGYKFIGSSNELKKGINAVTADIEKARAEFQDLQTDTEKLTDYFGLNFNTDTLVPDLTTASIILDNADFDNFLKRANISQEAYRNAFNASNLAQKFANINPEFLTQEQIAEIQAILGTTETDPEKLLALLNEKSVNSNSIIKQVFNTITKTQQENANNELKFENQHEWIQEKFSEAKNLDDLDELKKKYVDTGIIALSDYKKVAQTFILDEVNALGLSTDAWAAWVSNTGASIEKQRELLQKFQASAALDIIKPSEEFARNIDILNNSIEAAEKQAESATSADAFIKSLQKQKDLNKEIIEQQKKKNEALDREVKTREEAFEASKQEHQYTLRNLNGDLYSQLYDANGELNYDVAYQMLQIAKDTKNETAEIAIQELIDKQNILNDAQDEYFDGINELYDKTKEIYNNTINQISDIFDRQLETYQNLQRLINHDLNLVTLIYGEQAYGEMSKYYQKNTELLRKQLNVLDNEVERTYKNLQQFGADTTSAEYRQANQLYLDALEERADYFEQWLQSIKDNYINTVSDELKNFFDKTFGEGGQDLFSFRWDTETEQAERYLDIVNQTYELRKLEGKYQDSIKSFEGNVKAQQKLNDLLKEQQKYLQEKDRLSQYDLERANALYDLEVKRLQLEEARNNATKMQLVRDSEGNYRYQFVADQDNIAERQQEYQDSQANLWNIQKDRTEELINEYLQLQDKMKQDLAEVTNKPLEEQEKYRQEVLDRYFGENGLFASLGYDFDSVYDDLKSSLPDIAEAMGLSVDDLWAVLSTFTELAGTLGDKDYEALKKQLEGTASTYEKEFGEAKEEGEGYLQDVTDTDIAAADTQVGYLNEAIIELVKSLTGPNGLISQFEELNKSLNEIINRQVTPISPNNTNPNKFNQPGQGGLLQANAGSNDLDYSDMGNKLDGKIRDLGHYSLASMASAQGTMQGLLAAASQSVFNNVQSLYIGNMEVTTTEAGLNGFADISNQAYQNSGISSVTKNDITPA